MSEEDDPETLRLVINGLRMRATNLQRQLEERDDSNVPALPPRIPPEALPVAFRRLLARSDFMTPPYFSPSLCRSSAIPPVKATAITAAQQQYLITVDFLVTQISYVAKG